MCCALQIPAVILFEHFLKGGETVSTLPLRDIIEALGHLRVYYNLLAAELCINIFAVLIFVCMCHVKCSDSCGVGKEYEKNY